MDAEETLGSTRGLEARGHRPIPTCHWLSALIAWLRDVSRRRRDQRLLLAMSERELNDIGLSRADGSAFSGRPRRR